MFRASCYIAHVLRCVFYSSCFMFYTLRGLGGLGPLLGIGVKSRIKPILNPCAAKDLMADSLPAPIPLTLMPTSLIPSIFAFSAINSETFEAGRGVPFLAPLNPKAPDEEDRMTFPPSSLMAIIVLL